MTEILIDQISSLSSKLKIVSDNRSDDTDIEVLQQRSLQVADIKNKAVTYTSLIEDMNTLEELDLKIHVDFSTWVTSYIEFRQKFTEAGEEIQSMDANIVTQFFKMSKGFFTTVEKSLVEHWQKICESIFNSPSVEGLEILGQISSNAPHIRVINHTLTELDLIKRDLPENFHGAIAKLKSITKSFKDAFDQLDTSGLNPSIQKFLRAIKDQTCTLADVDETVLEWLKEKQSSRKYRVNLRPW